MNTPRLALAAALVVSAMPTQAGMADDAQMQRLALCQDSWLDWKDDSARMTDLVDYFESRIARSPQGSGAFDVKAPLRVLGQPVTQVYPQSVGMGVGFSLTVKAGFGATRAAVERRLGKSMACTSGDGMQACELQVGPKKTVVLMAPLNGAAKATLMGCYYFYQQ